MSFKGSCKIIKGKMEGHMSQDIVRLTEQLITLTEEANSIYDAVRKDGVEKDFYHEIKPFADQVKQVCEEWNRK